MLEDIKRKRAVLHQINLMLVCSEISDCTRNALLADRDRIISEIAKATVDMAERIKREGVGVIINP